MKACKDWRYKLLMFKRYFEQGYGLTNYLKYLIAFFGLASSNLKLTLALGILYVPVCFLLGWYWYNHGWIILDTEISNQFNLFCKEVRKKLK